MSNGIRDVTTTGIGRVAEAEQRQVRETGRFKKWGVRIGRALLALATGFISEGIIWGVHRWKASRAQTRTEDRRVEAHLQREAIREANREMAIKYSQKHGIADYVELGYAVAKLELRFNKAFREIDQDKVQRLRDEIRQEIETFPRRVDEGKAMEIVKRRAKQLIKREINAEVARLYSREGVIKNEFKNIEGELNWDKSIDDIPQSLIHRFCERIKEKIENHKEIVDGKKALKIIREEIQMMVAVCKITPDVEVFLEELKEKVEEKMEEKVKAMVDFTKAAITLSNKMKTKDEDSLLTEAIYHGINTKGYNHNTIQTVYQKLALDEGLDFIQALHDISFSGEDPLRQKVGMSLWQNFLGILAAFVDKLGLDEDNYEKESQKIQGSGKFLDQIPENIKNLANQIIADNIDWYNKHIFKTNNA